LLSCEISCLISRAFGVDSNWQISHFRIGSISSIDKDQSRMIRWARGPREILDHISHYSNKAMSLVQTFKPVVGRKIRFALVGCGRISKNHLSAIEKHNDSCEVVDVCDIDPDALSSAVDKTGAQGFGSLGELLEATTADCVIIATPSGLHSNQAIRIANTEMARWSGNGKCLR
jgi:hypothetical protein